MSTDPTDKPSKTLAELVRKFADYAEKRSREGATSAEMDLLNMRVNTASLCVAIERDAIEAARADERRLERARAERDIAALVRSHGDPNAIADDIEAGDYPKADPEPAPAPVERADVVMCWRCTERPAVCYGRDPEEGHNKTDLCTRCCTHLASDCTPLAETGRTP